MENVVEANILALTVPGIEGEIFNIGNGAPNSVNELLKALNNIMGKNISAAHLPPRAGDVRKTHSDISKAEKLLGWKPKTGFEEGLTKAVNWFKENELRWRKGKS